MLKFAVLALCVLGAVAVDKSHLRANDAHLHHHHNHHEPKSAIQETVESAQKDEHTGPAVVSQSYCASILLAIKKHEAPYWDKEGLEGSGCCSEDRPDLLRQCEKILDGFILKIHELCPSLKPADEVEDGYKKVKYVPDIATAATSSQLKRKAEAAPVEQCPKQCEDECECCCNAEKKKVEPLKRTPDGKPVADWAEHPQAPSSEVEAMAKYAQDVEDCGNKPCKVVDFESMAPKEVQEDAEVPSPEEAEKEDAEVPSPEEAEKEEAQEEEVEKEDPAVQELVKKHEENAGVAQGGEAGEEKEEAEEENDEAAGEEKDEALEAPTDGDVDSEAAKEVKQIEKELDIEGI